MRNHMNILTRLI